VSSSFFYCSYQHISSFKNYIKLIKLLQTIVGSEKIAGKNWKERAEDALDIVYKNAPGFAKAAFNEKCEAPHVFLEEVAFA